MRQVFTLIPDDGEQLTLVADSRDILMWERMAKGRSLGALGKDARISDFYEVAHIAARRKRGFDGALPDFEAAYAIDLVDEDDVEEDDDEEVPTRAAP